MVLSQQAENRRARGSGTPNAKMIFALPPSRARAPSAKQDALSSAKGRNANTGNTFQKHKTGRAAATSNNNIAVPPSLLPSTRLSTKATTQTGRATPRPSSHGSNAFKHKMASATTAKSPHSSNFTITSPPKLSRSSSASTTQKVTAGGAIFKKSLSSFAPTPLDDPFSTPSGASSLPRGTGTHTNTANFAIPLRDFHQFPQQAANGRGGVYSSFTGDVALRHTPKKSAQAFPVRTSNTNASSTATTHQQVVISTKPRMAAAPTFYMPTKSSKNNHHKFKTELCKNFMAGKHCPFGENCHYAHGESELHLSSVEDLIRNGDITDSNNIGSRPCPTFVATGACPFGVRCKFLHDPRIKQGSDDKEQNSDCWLEHFENPVKEIHSDLIINNRHHHFANEVHYGSPFGKVLHPIIESFASDTCNGPESLTNHPKYMDQVWSTFYDGIVGGQDLNCVSLVQGIPTKEVTATSTAGPSFGSVAAMPGTIPVLPSYYGPQDSFLLYHTHTYQEWSDLGTLTEMQRLEIVLKMCYTPKAQWHKYSTNCKIFGRDAMIVQHAYFAITDNGTIQTVSEQAPYSFSVLEVAHGSDADLKAKAQAALYFNIPHEYITKWNAHQPNHPGMDWDVYLSTSPNRPFYLTRPHDDEAMALVVGIIEHRLGVLKTPHFLEDLAAIKRIDPFHRSVAAEKIKMQISLVEVTGLGLHSKFESLVKHWASIFWGRCSELADLSDPGIIALRVESNYNPQEFPKYTGGAISEHLWSSFVNKIGRNNCGSSPTTSRLVRLAVCDIAVCDMAPYSTANFVPILERHEYDPNASDETRCWQDLLLTDEGQGEWETAREDLLLTKQRKVSKRKSPTTIAETPTPKSEPLSYISSYPATKSVSFSLPSWDEASTRHYA